MKKKKWKKIRGKPSHLIVTLVLIISLMGMSYGAWSDRLIISGSITIANPEPPIDQKIAGELWLAIKHPHSIWGATSKCLHMEENEVDYCNEKNCDYQINQRGLVARYKISNNDLEKSKSINEIILKVSYTLKYKNKGIGEGAEYTTYTQSGGSEIGWANFIKVQGPNGPEYINKYEYDKVTILPGETYTVENNLSTRGVPIADKAHWDEPELKEIFPEFYKNDGVDVNRVCEELDIHAGIEITVKYSGGVKDDEIKLERKLGLKPKDSDFTKIPQTTPSAIIIVPPAVTLPEITTSSPIIIQPLPEEVMPLPEESNPMGELSKPSEPMMIEPRKIELEDD